MVGRPRSHALHYTQDFWSSNVPHELESSSSSGGPENLFPQPINPYSEADNIDELFDQLIATTDTITLHQENNKLAVDPSMLAGSAWPVMHSPEFDYELQNHPFHANPKPSHPPLSGNQHFFTDTRKPKKSRQDQTINFRSSSNSPASSSGDPDMEAIAQMKEMIYRAAAFRPVSFEEETASAEARPRRKNVKISSEPQTVAARKRRERISEKIRALQRLVPGGDKMDTASTLEEAANYLKYLRSQVSAMEKMGEEQIESAMAASGHIFHHTNQSQYCHPHYYYSGSIS